MNEHLVSQAEMEERKDQVRKVLEDMLSGPAPITLIVMMEVAESDLLRTHCVGPLVDISALFQQGVPRVGAMITHAMDDVRNGTQGPAPGEKLN